MTSISLRDRLAHQAPITSDVVDRIYGAGIGNTDEERAIYFGLWALLSFEWADAMIEEAERRLELENHRERER